MQCWRMAEQRDLSHTDDFQALITAKYLIVTTQSQIIFGHANKSTEISSVKLLTSNLAGHQITPCTIKLFSNNLIFEKKY